MPVKGDYLSGAQAALDSANQFSKEITPQVKSSGPDESVGMQVLHKMLGIADLAALPALFVPGADVPAGAYLAARSGQSAINNFRTGHPVKGAIDAAMAVPMVGGAVRGVRGIMSAAEDAARVAKETGAVRESVSMAKDLLENGFSHGAAGKIAGVPSKGKSSMTAIRHLSQLPDEEAGAERVAATRAGRQGRGDAMNGFQRQTPDVVPPDAGVEQSSPTAGDVDTLAEQSKQALAKIRRAPAGPPVVKVHVPEGQPVDPVSAVRHSDPLEETLNTIHGEDGDWPDNSMLDRLSRVSRSAATDDTAGMPTKGNGTYREPAGDNWPDRLNGVNQVDTARAVLGGRASSYSPARAMPSPANLSRTAATDDVAAGDQQAVQRILFGGPQGVPGAPFPPRGPRLPLDKFSLDALINTIRTGG